MSCAHPKALGLVLLGAVSPAPCLACPQGWWASGWCWGAAGAVPRSRRWVGRDVLHMGVLPRAPNKNLKPRIVSALLRDPAPGEPVWARRGGWVREPARAGLWDLHGVFSALLLFFPGVGNTAGGTAWP